MNYQEALAVLQGQDWRLSRPGLERVYELLRRLGNPEKELKIVHVAGTNGKGSVCVMLASILAEAGYKTGMYTSPHLMEYAERMQINGVNISDEEFIRLVEDMKPAIDAMEDKPTEFESFTAAAFLYFARQACDIVVLEVGMGGLEDATNVIGTPEAAAILNIGLEHTAILGDTIEKIAAHKAGIIKQDGDAVLYAQSPEVEAVVRAACERTGSRLVITEPDKGEALESGLFGQTFRYKEHGPLKLGLAGGYQVGNAEVVLEVVDLLRTKGWHIPEDAVRRGLETVRWPARFELLYQRPTVVLDGAHNPNGVEKLVEALKQCFPERKMIFVMGSMADKNHREIFRLVAPLAEKLITVRTDYYRAAASESLAQEAEEYLPADSVLHEDTVAAGLDRALRLAEPDDILCVFGSLYQVAEVKAYFEKL